MATIVVNENIDMAENTSLISNNINISQTYRDNYVNGFVYSNVDDIVCSFTDSNRTLSINAKSDTIVA